MNFLKIKKTNKFNVILFIALVPDEVDRNWDIITAEEITKTAYEFFKNIENKSINVDHKDKVIEWTFVESYLLPIDMETEEWIVPAGSWIVGIQFDEDIYNQIESWEYVGISIEWEATTEKVI